MENKGAMRAWTLTVVVLALAVTVGTVSALSTADRPERMSPAALPASAAQDRAQGLSAGDTFTLALAADVWTLDPAASTDGLTFLVTGQIYDTLVNHEPGGTLPLPGLAISWTVSAMPSLAESWTVSADNLTWTFQLRPGLKFHDGTDLDAAAVVYNLTRWWDPAHPYHQDFEYFRTMFYGFKGDPGCLISHVAAIGSDRVQIVLSRPYSALPSTLAMPSFAIASPAAIQAGTLATRPVGSGPFRFVQWVPGDRIRLAANTTYWQGAPYLEALVFRVLGGAGARLAALQSGAAQGTTLDWTSWNYVPTATLDANLKVVWQPSLSTGYLGINRAHPPLDNTAVRQAIAHALNKPAIVHQEDPLDTGGGQVASQLLPPAQWGRDEALFDYAYNPTQARSLLAEAGLPAGFATTLWVMPMNRFTFPQAQAAADAMEADLEAVGISITQVTFDWSTYLSKVGNGEADLFMLGWGSDNGHPDNFFYPNLCDSYLRYGPRDDPLCAQLEAARAVANPSTLLGIYQWASQRVHATLPLVPIEHTRPAWVLRRNMFGFEPGPIDPQSFRTAFLADAQVDLSPGAAGSMTYTDTQGSPTVVQVSAGAVTETTTLAYAALATAPAGPGLFAGHGFRLEAYRQGQSLPGFVFGTPATVTIEYSAADVAGLEEDTLTLYAWDGAGWSTAGIMLVQRDQAHHRLVVTVAHLSEFALFARGQYPIYLPLTRRNTP